MTTFVARPTRRSRTRFGLTVALLALPALLLGSAASAVQVDRASSLTHHQSVIVDVDPSGGVRTARIVTQLDVLGDGRVAVDIPDAPTAGLRNLGGFSRPSVVDGAIRWEFDVDGAAQRRLLADFDRDLPVELTIAYALDGREVRPGDVVGQDGELTITYTARNTTATPTDVEYLDAYGNRLTETADVAIPYVGTLALTLDDRFGDVEAPGAVMAGDGQGGTALQWSMLLFEPLGSIESEVSLTATVHDAVVPAATLQFAPVSSRTFGTLGTAQEQYDDGAADARKVARGANDLDMAVQRLQAGASQLLAGLVQLADGSAELADGLQDADDGAGQIADGLDAADDGGEELASGLQQLDGGSARLLAGARDLSSGATTLDQKTGELAAGTVQLADGSRQLLAGLLQLHAGINDPAQGLPTAIGGVGQLSAGVSDLTAGIGAVGTDGTLLDGLSKVAVGLADAQQGIGDPATPDTLRYGAARVTGGLSNPACDPADPANPANPCGLLQGAQGTSVGAAQLRAGLDNPACVLADPTDPDNPCGVKQMLQILSATVGDPTGIIAGLITSINDRLVPGISQIKTGADAAVAGIGSSTTEDTLLYGMALISGGLADLSAGIGDPATVDTLRNGVARITGGVSNAACDPTDPADPANPCGLLEGLLLVGAGLGDLGDGLDGALGSVNAGLGSTTAPGETLLYGASQLSGGTAQLADGAAQLRQEGTGPLAAGAGQLSSGASELAAGAAKAADGGDELSAGLGKLAAGASALSDGLGDAADGSGTLAQGMTNARLGGTQLADGATQLQEDGSEVLKTEVSDSASDRRLTAERLRAVDVRGQEEGLPYGGAESATTTAAYRYVISGLDGSGTRNLGRSGGAVVTLAGAGLIAAFVRRRMGLGWL